MTTLLKEPYTLNFQEAEFNNEVRKAEQAATHLQPYLDELTAINGLTLTETLFRDFTGKGERTADVIQAETLKQLGSANIASKALREAAIKGDLETFYSLHNRMKGDYRLKEGIHSVSIGASGRAFVSDAFKEKLKEQYTSRITTDKGMQAYEAHKAMIAAINNFLEVSGIPARNISQYYFRALEANTISMPLIDYDRIVS